MAPSSSPRPPTVICTAESFPVLNESGRREEICIWLGLNGIDPNSAAIDEITVEDDEDGQRVIRYTAFLRNEEGRIYEDPDDPRQAARERRARPCVVEPPGHWALDS